jgi:hypothetical protein
VQRFNRLTKELILDRVKFMADGCWQWNGTINSRGYGQVAIKQKIVRAHRASFHVFRGFALDSPLLVCHKCNNPLCVNPKHLYAGTPVENAMDAVHAGGTRWNTNRGSKSALAKLTAMEIRVIRSAYGRGISQLNLAKQYNVHANTIWRIINRITYKQETT